MLFTLGDNETPLSAIEDQVDTTRGDHLIHANAGERYSCDSLTQWILCASVTSEFIDS